MTQAFVFRLQVKGPDRSWEYVIPEGRSNVGRQVGSDLLLEHPQISRQHASFDCSATQCTITDLNSSNGTLVNAEALTPDVPVRVTSNDVIKIGPFSLQVEQVLAEPPQIEEQPVEDIAAKPVAEKAAVGEEPYPLKDVEVSIEPDVEPGEPPPPKPPYPPPGYAEPEPAAEMLVPPGLSFHSSRLINYLPDIYHTDFTSRLLGIFEAILTPIEWNAGNFDLFLDPASTPRDFLPWLANWFAIVFDSTWREEQRRELLEQAHIIFARRGTRWALSRVLEIYTGQKPEINDQDGKLEPHTFSVKIPLSKKDTHPELIEAIIDAHKPAHTTYELKYGSS